MVASRDSAARRLCVGKAFPQVLVSEAPLVDVSSLWILQTCTVPLVAPPGTRGCLDSNPLKLSK